MVDTLNDAQLKELHTSFTLLDGEHFRGSAGREQGASEVSLSTMCGSEKEVHFRRGRERVEESECGGGQESEKRERQRWPGCWSVLDRSVRNNR
eukprot:2634699-Rhodomonas_salina.1